MRELLNRLLLQPLRAADAEARANVARDGRVGLDARVIAVLVTTAVVCVLIEYVGMSNRYSSSVALLDAIGLGDAACWLDRTLDAWRVERYCAAVRDNPDLRSHPDLAADVRLARQVYWAGWSIIAYLLVPLIVSRAVGLRWADVGLRVRGSMADGWVYALLVALMLPVVWTISATESFGETYPFYDLRPGEPKWPTFVAAELLYVAQFFALEFFFRGFVLHGLRPRLGAAAVLVMVVPYCMIHFGKPLPETLGAIGAGLILGALSLKSGSVLPGALVHVGVALSMDAAALIRKGMFWN